MMQIEIDFEVFKALTMRRADESVSYNDVLRDLLDLRLDGPSAAVSPTDGRAWVVKGVSFPHGTQLRASYKGRRYTGKVEDGALIVEGERHSSPSAGAMAITDSPVNGWTFWEARIPGETSWTRLDWFRR